MNNLHNKARNSLAAAVAVGSLYLAMPASVVAQTNTDARLMDEIIVTARGREENLQDVSIAISAFDETSIERRGITELEDVARFTAGFAFEDGDGGAANPVIRGQATLRPTAREQTVATFLDGVYMPRSWLVDLGTSNLQRIEVVKGPQSARYGRNAFAGAINFIPHKASLEELKVAGSINYGSDELKEFGGSIDVPVIDGVLGVRAAFDTTEFDGSWENNHPNANAGVSPGTNGNVGGWDNDSAAISVIWNPLDSLRFDLGYYTFDKEEEARAGNWLSTGFAEGNCGPLQVQGAGYFSLFCGEYPVEEDEVTIDPRGFGRQSEADITRIGVDFDITDTMTLSYVFSNVDAESFAAVSAETDHIGCAAVISFLGTCNFQGAPVGYIDYDQHELSLSFNASESISGKVGLFSLDGEDLSQSVSMNVAPLSTTPLDPQGTNTAGLPFPLSVASLRFNDEATDTDVNAIFAEVTYHISDATRVSLEARYTKEEIATVNLINGDGFKEEFDFITPKLTVEHDLDSDKMIYASLARGAKAGGFNVGAVSKPGAVRGDGSVIQEGDSDNFATFDPEFNVTLEVGTKSSLLDGRAVLNIAAFYTEWSDLQINSSDPLGTNFTAALTRNLGDATIYGAEIESSYFVTDNLSLDVALSHTIGEYDSGTIDELYIRGTASFPAPCDGTVCAADGSIGGNDLERAPKTQFSLGTQWEAPVSDGMNYYIRGDMGYQSSFYADSINAAQMPSRTVFNASTGLSGENWRLTFWARNLFDEKYVSNSSAIIQSFSNNLLGTYYGERRTYGLTLKVEY